ncbi:MAG: SGNH/GDSL hydrolase family protein [Pseudomonadota bacterium]
MKTMLKAAAVLLALSATNLHASTTNLLAFGDSLIDSGNLDLAIKFRGGTGINDTVDGFLPPRSYPNGQFTNGNTWATQLGLTPSLAGGSNFGFGGAKAVADDDGILDLQAQVDAFRKSGLAVDGNTTAAIWIGGNDFRAFTPDMTRQDVNGAVQGMVKSIAQSVKSLHRFGVGNVLVLGLPEIDVLPAAVGQFNNRVSSLLARMDARLPNNDFRYYDINGLFQQVLVQTALDPTRDLAPVPCIFNPSDCAANPLNYLLYDEIHPTEWVHTILAQELGRELATFENVAPIPLPATAPLMLAALGGFGLWARRRKSRA